MARAMRVPAVSNMDPLKNLLDPLPEILSLKEVRSMPYWFVIPRIFPVRSDHQVRTYGTLAPATPPLSVSVRRMPLSEDLLVQAAGMLILKSGAVVSSMQGAWTTAKYHVI